MSACNNWLMVFHSVDRNDFVLGNQRIQLSFYLPGKKPMAAGTIVSACKWFLIENFIAMQLSSLLPEAITALDMFYVYIVELF